MNGKTIAELKQMFQTMEVTETFIKQLKDDPRKGVQRLIESYERNKAKKALLKKQFSNMLTYEQRLWKEGFNYVAGVDEAGRGPLAGPVVAAAVILPDDFTLLGINDSKALTTEERQLFYEKIKENAIAYHISYVHADLIDQLNILEATKRAMVEALVNLQPRPNIALIDAVNLQQSPIKTDTIIKGDEKSVTIAAASILAKVSRDHYMTNIHEKYPEYNFHRHKGYGTREHLKQLKRHGISPIHRCSFAPVKRYI